MSDEDRPATLRGQGQCEQQPNASDERQTQIIDNAGHKTSLPQTGGDNIPHRGDKRIEPAANAAAHSRQQKMKAGRLPIFLCAASLALRNAANQAPTRAQLDASKLAAFMLMLGSAAEYLRTHKLISTTAASVIVLLLAWGAYRLGSAR